MTRLTTETITIAARTDIGRLRKIGASTIAVASTSAAVMSEASWVRFPDASPVADWLKLASTGNPPKRPLATFEDPIAISSWSGSMS